MENVEKPMFSTAIPAVWKTGGLCMGGCIIGPPADERACYVAGGTGAVFCRKTAKKLRNPSKAPESIGALPGISEKFL